MMRLRNSRELDCLLRGIAPSAAKSVTQRRRSGAAMPEEILTSALVAKVGEDAVPQFRGAVPGRRYILDVAFPKARLAVEIDGWQYHGKHLDDFKRDRERDRLLVLNGWFVLRFVAGEVRKDPEYCVAMVEQCIRSIESRRQ